MNLHEKVKLGYKTVLHHKYIRLTSYTRRMPDFSECLVRAVEFGSGDIEDKM